MTHNLTTCLRAEADKITEEEKAGLLLKPRDVKATLGGHTELPHWAAPLSCHTELPHRAATPSCHTELPH